MNKTRYANEDKLKGLTLGKATEYSNQYDPSLLQSVPRRLNRDDLELDANQELPFIGSDLWTLYELSWLNTKGLPQVAIGHVSLPFSSPNLIESKSFKLYLNSLNQTHFDTWQEVEDTLITDLSICAGLLNDATLNDTLKNNSHLVSVHICPISDYDQSPIVNMAGTCIDNQDIEIDSYQFSPEYLCNAVANNNAPSIEETLHSHLLKSNCLITNQPDWGSVEITYTGEKINREALLRYLVSFREHNEFHEQCVERIFCDIMKYCEPKELTVYARYTRRGGLDINPFRSTHLIQPDNINRMARQ